MIPKFWEAIRHHPLLNGHVVKRQPRWNRRCIPISVHGDGVPVTGVGKSWGKSMEMLSWASCLASGATLSTFNFIYGIFATALVTEGRSLHGNDFFYA